MSVDEQTSDSTPGVELPLFPLHTVLFPGGLLPLRIFEPRYLEMVGRCLKEEQPFGALLIYAGAEAGTVQSTAEVGTSARIVDFQQLPDGLLGILCIGERKFRVSNIERRSNGLHVGTVSWLPPDPEVPVPAEYAHLTNLLRKVLPELASLHPAAAERYDDAGWVSHRLAEILPISLADKQYCLELEDPLARLARLGPVVKSQGA